MKQVKLRYDRDSTLKKVAMSKQEAWPLVMEKIASAFGKVSTEICKIIVGDAELEVTDSIPTLGDYLTQF